LVVALLLLSTHGELSYLAEQRTSGSGSNTLEQLQYQTELKLELIIVSKRLKTITLLRMRTKIIES